MRRTFLPGKNIKRDALQGRLFDCVRIGWDFFHSVTVFGCATFNVRKILRLQPFKVGIPSGVQVTDNILFSHKITFAEFARMK